MNATGVIVEYNPFHNGHDYHIKETRAKTGADVVIAIMSGHFLQRGEPALIDKWTRAKMALRSGVDIVIELPYRFATARAEEFAFGGVTILDALKCQTISFGSEEGSIQTFEDTYSLLTTHHDEIQRKVSESIKSGISYPQALNNAHQSIALEHGESLVDLSLPNNILGYHYVEQIHRHLLSIKPMTIQRVKAGYHEDASPLETIASATGIRKSLFSSKKDLEAIRQYLPSTSFDLLKDAHTFSSWEQFYPILRFTLLRMTREEIAMHVDVVEGIEHLIWKAAKECDQFESFMQRIKSKRYTWTRIQRMLTHLLVGFKKDVYATFKKPSYIRILGMTENGQKYLSNEKKNFTLPLISRVASSDDKQLSLDIRATDLYTLANGFKDIGLDYKTPPIRERS